MACRTDDPDTYEADVMPVQISRSPDHWQNTDLEIHNSVLAGVEFTLDRCGGRVALVQIQNLESFDKP